MDFNVKGEKAMFNIGDRVEWKSQSGGSTKIKTGTVVMRVEKGQSAIRIHKATFPDHSRMFDGLSRNHVSFLVEVIKNTATVPKLYWQRVSGLKLIP